MFDVIGSGRNGKKVDVLQERLELTEKERNVGVSLRLRSRFFFCLR